MIKDIISEDELPDIENTNETHKSAYLSHATGCKPGSRYVEERKIEPFAGMYREQAKDKEDIFPNY